MVPSQPAPDSTPLHDPATGETCGTPTKPGPGITSPKPVYTPEPDLTDSARRKKLQGTVVMVIDVGADGLVKHVCLLRSLKKDMDERTIKMARSWRFEPARKDGVPIPYTTTADVTFVRY